jgi:hypothetical protein
MEVVEKPCGTVTDDRPNLAENRAHFSSSRQLALVPIRNIETQVNAGRPSIQALARLVPARGVGHEPDRE